MSWQHYCRVEPYELHVIRPGSAYETRGAHVQGATRNFNNIARFVSQSILAFEKVDQRAKMFSKWLKVADHARRLFASDVVMMVIAGLNLGPVFRLKNTKSKLTSSHRKRFDVLTELASSQGAYKLLRRFEASSTGSCIPYMGVVLTDVRFSLRSPEPTFDDTLLVCLVDDVHLRRQPRFQGRRDGECEYGSIRSLREGGSRLPALANSTVPFPAAPRATGGPGPAGSR